MYLLFLFIFCWSLLRRKQSCRVCRLASFICLLFVSCRFLFVFYIVKQAYIIYLIKKIIFLSLPNLQLILHWLVVWHHLIIKDCFFFKKVVIFIIKIYDFLDTFWRLLFLMIWIDLLDCVIHRCEEELFLGMLTESSRVRNIYKHIHYVNTFIILLFLDAMTPKIALLAFFTAILCIHLSLLIDKLRRSIVIH